jgi:hypothetical protein
VGLDRAPVIGVEERFLGQTDAQGGEDEGGDDQ